MTDKLADAYDSDAHGTHCAGIICGGDASGRWIGMAPKAKVLAGLVLKGGSGTDAQILAGMEWAVRSRAQVISLSLGGLRLAADVLDTYTRTIINANRLGIPVVVAVGNEGSQTSGSPGNDYFAFTVGATDSEDWAAGFSGGRTQVFTSSRYIKPEYLPLVYSKPDVSCAGDRYLFLRSEGKVGGLERHFHGDPLRSRRDGLASRDTDPDRISASLPTHEPNPIAPDQHSKATWRSGTEPPLRLRPDQRTTCAGLRAGTGLLLSLIGRRGWRQTTPPDRRGRI